jgi:hypothetical protein
MNIEQTSPQLYRTGGYRIDQAIADPSVTLIEMGDEFGFLLSESAYDTAIDDRLVLENVLWAKGVVVPGFFSGHTELARRELDEVSLFRHDSGVYVAQDLATRFYLPQPSAIPYAVVFITQDQYEDLRQQITMDAFYDVIDTISIVLDGVPGFAVDGDALIGPATYARGLRGSLDQPLLGS